MLAAGKIKNGTTVPVTDQIVAQQKPPRVTPKSDAIDATKPTVIGGAQRPPANAVELPMLGGRPKVETFDGLWKQIDTAFASAKPASMEAAIGLFGAMGFIVDHAKHGQATLVKGGFAVKLEDESFGKNAAIKIKLEGKDGVERSTVSIFGAQFPKALFMKMRERYDAVLDTFKDAMHGHGKRALPTTFDSLKTFIEGAKSTKAQAKDAIEDAEVKAKIDALTAKLEDMQAKGTAPKNVIIYTDGPDGAGKSSTGAIVMQALSKVGFTSDAAIFKAPTAEERGQHWLQRFEDKGVPTETNVARFWDRGPGGDAVYGKKTPAEVKEMAKELKTFEKKLANDGVLLFKVHIYADQDKQAETFGKRLARQEAANIIEEQLTKRGKLTGATSDALENIRSRIDGDDFKAMVTFDDVQAKFSTFSKLTGYNVVDASDRHAARLEIIDALSAQLDAWASKHAG